MVVIATNRPEYGNDIAEEIRLFLGFSDICVQEEPDGAAELCLIDMMYEKDDSYRISASLDDYVYSDAFCVDADTTGLERKKREKRHIKLAAYHLLRRRFPLVNPPWGSLTGIRPTKLMRELSGSNGIQGAKEQFLNTFCVSEGKTELAAAIVRVQQPVIASARAEDADIYIGIPYCRTRCLYCSFGSVVPKKAEELDRYIAALYRDIDLGAKLVKDGGYHVRAAYIGGGTPTILSEHALDALLQHAKKSYGSLGSELTVEAGRPDTIDAEKLRVLKEHGVNRISINPQTMNDRTLVRMGRSHSVADVIDTLALARKFGFDWINMDLIAALPGETPADMENSCRQIERLAPENLTVHALAVKRSERWKSVRTEYPLADAAAADEMIRIGAQTAENLGMVPYYMYRQKYMSGNLENVGYAKPDRICIYNIDMMEESVSILSNGAGSMTKRVFNGESRIERVPSPKDVSTYCEKLPELYNRKRALFLD